MKVTPEDIDTVVERIRATADDDEVAHSMEDDLYAGLLKAIADGDVEDAPECARRALKAGDIKFSRWCA